MIQSEPTLIQPKVNSEEDLFRLAHEDPRYIIQSSFSIVDKNKEIIPFIFNNLQNEFYEERTLRDDVLKPSQIGFSSMILAILTVKFLLVPNSWSVCISHEDEATKRLFAKVEFFLNTLPDDLKTFCKLRTDNVHNLENEAMNSKFYIGTAGSRSFGRGDTPHYAHLSEVSRWKDQGRVATNILRAVPLDNPNTWIVKETTANGQGNYHHIEYQREKDGKSEFKPHFPLWLKHEEYKIVGAKIDPETLTEEEKHYIRRFPEFTDEWIAWRRKMIRTLVSEAGRPPEDIFKQEFPFDDKEAFLFSGNPIFPPKQIENYKDKAKEPLIQGNLVGVSPNQTIDETKQGWLKIWKLPTTDGQYIMFADVGQFSDFCVATVVDKKTWNVVAKFRANITAWEFGSELNKLGSFYNNAEIAVEVNNMGQSTADRLVSLNYPNLYMRERLDEKKKIATKVVGWHTSEKTKVLMIGHMQELIRAEEVEIPDKEILDEFSTFIKTETGGMEASEGNWDDQVISCSGVYYVLKLHPFQEKVALKQPFITKVRKYRELRSARRMAKFRNLSQR